MLIKLGRSEKSFKKIEESVVTKIRCEYTVKKKPKTQ